MRKIINSAVKDWIPDENGILKEIDPVVKKLKKLAPKVIIGGSLAKGTILKGDYDVDIFIPFKKDGDLSAQLEKILKKAGLNPERVHGSRDYFHVEPGLEIVPVLDVAKAEDAHNVTDMSPMHVKWVKANIGKLGNDIRAAKLFCKSLRIYGAESYVRGFSGHVLDILVIHYKGLDKLLKSASSWKAGVVIDPNNHYKGKARMMMNASKLGPIIVVDPVDPTRNAAAAVNESALKEFAKAARRFVNKPSESFFKPYEFSLEKLTKKHLKRNLVIVLPKVKDGKEDVVGAALLKDFEKLDSGLKSEGFDLKDSGWFWDKGSECIYWFAADPKPLPKTREHMGPFIKQEDHCKAFKKKYPKSKKKGDRLCAIVPILHRTVQEYVSAHIKAEIMVHGPA